MESEAKKEYQLKKQERLQKREEVSRDSKKGAGTKKIIVWLIVIAVIVLIILGIKTVIDKNTPKEEDFSISFPTSGRDHIQTGSAHNLPQGTYSSDPPSSGPHYPNTAKTGFYNEPIEDQFIIHNLEHGDIWIAYNPRVSSEVKDQLESLAGRFIIVSPRENNPTDISLVSWGRVDSFDLENDFLPEQRVRDFILRYDNKGPEQVRGGAGHQATSF